VIEAPEPKNQGVEVPELSNKAVKLEAEETSLDLRFYATKQSLISVQKREPEGVTT